MAFFTLLTNTLSSVAVKQGIIFENDVTNISGCYSKYTGVFVCCKPGLYLITWNIYMSSAHNVRTALMVNTTRVALIQQFASTQTVIIELVQADEVWIQITYRSPAGASIYEGSSFSGVLIQ